MKIDRKGNMITKFTYESITSTYDAKTPPRPELPLLSFPPFLVDDISSCEVTLAPRVPSIWGQIINSNRTHSLRNKQFNDSRVQNRQNVVATSNKGENKQTFFPEPFLLSRESPSWDLAFTSSTDLYVFTCASAGESTIKKSSPCALGARAPLDKLSVPLNNFFFHQYQHEHWNYQIINYSWMQIVPLLRKSLHRSWSSSQ